MKIYEFMTKIIWKIWGYDKNNVKNIWVYDKHNMKKIYEFMSKITKWHLHWIWTIYMRYTIDRFEVNFKCIEYIALGKT